MIPHDLPFDGASADPGQVAVRAGEWARAFALRAGDIALVLDPAGQILGVGQGEGPDADGWAAGWVGRDWIGTAHADSRAKVRRVLDELAATGEAGRREINQLAPGGRTVPVAYRAIRLGAGGPGLAIGRELGAEAAMQQRFTLALAQLEARYAGGR